jgi:hypothetical protein
MEIAGLGDVFSVCKTRGSSTEPSPSDNTVNAEVQEWFREPDTSLYRQGSENIIVLYDRCLNKFGDEVEK